MTDPRYPIGPFSPPASVSDEDVQQWIDDIEKTPARLRAAVAGLDDAQTDTPYRPGGWTVRQIVHHLPDSHINSYTRMKLAMTEDTPTIRTYVQDGWANLADARTAPLDDSLDLLDALHRRWVRFLRTLGERDLARTFQHPDLGELTIGITLAIYAWHGKHHVAHITTLREQKGW